MTKQDTKKAEKKKPEKKVNVLQSKTYWEKGGLYDYYRIRLKFRDFIYGGIPKTASVIEAWIRARAAKAGHELSGPELEGFIKKTAEEMGITMEEAEEKIKGLKESEIEKSWTGFKRNGKGVYIEQRQIKAAIKQCASTLQFTAIRGSVGGVVGFKHTLKEGVFADPAQIILAPEETGFHEFVGHITGPKGPQSIIQRMDYVEQAEIEIIVKAIRTNTVKDWHIQQIFELMQESGLGARRSQECGKFDMLSFEQVERP